MSLGSVAILRAAFQDWMALAYSFFAKAVLPADLRSAREAA